ncbi:PaaI family thioesterase [Verrucomicrobiaceae bacterium N1E253]|uniref:Acyl-coenzyme A thioesterase THEM4 n=1 Tax=Oceaniferula marina TaxID=2748318 RepID=A0A851GIC0_9BACT|nr:PaaI family thioesterase [Oceaniferula marina]NWK57538.1 PaaI family thioesterase [Oceaniferula marina]
METPELAQLKQLRKKHHQQCVACNHPDLRLDFRLSGQRLVARWQPRNSLTSYQQTLHGGIQALLIDEAMTCYMMSLGIVAVTADLQIRYHDTVRPDQALYLHTRLIKRRKMLFLLESQLRQGGRCHVMATGKFLPKP